MKEQEFEALTLMGHGNNVHLFLSVLPEKRNKIDFFLPTGGQFPSRQFNTTIFDQLKKSTCDDFPTNVKEAKAR